jgi:hypothetical protein
MQKKASKEKIKSRTQPTHMATVVYETDFTEPLRG